MKPVQRGGWSGGTVQPVSYRWAVVALVAGVLATVASTLVINRPAPAMSPRKTLTAGSGK